MSSGYPSYVTTTSRTPARVSSTTRHAAPVVSSHIVAPLHVQRTTHAAYVQPVDRTYHHGVVRSSANSYEPVASTVIRSETSLTSPRPITPTKGHVSTITPQLGRPGVYASVSSTTAGTSLSEVRPSYIYEDYPTRSRRMSEPAAKIGLLSNSSSSASSLDADDGEGRILFLSKPNALDGASSIFKGAKHELGQPARLTPRRGAYTPDRGAGDAHFVAHNSSFPAQPSYPSQLRERSAKPLADTKVTCETGLAELSALEKMNSAQVDMSEDGSTLHLHVKLLPSERIGWNEVTLIELISTGSFGEVFLAKFQGGHVGVKRCIIDKSGRMTREQLRNMEREINMFRTLDHPNIVRYIGCVLEYPNLAIVTEYLPNGNVFDLLYTRGVQLQAGIRLRISNQLTLAVSYMHNCDPVVIHRDLKTQNLVLDRDYNVKLCDFGKTKPLDDNDMLQLKEDNGGSPRYMAPECFTANGFITEKVDIWSLACCLVEMLGGPLPYEDAPQMSEVITLILRERRPPLVPPWFVPDIQPVLGQCFEFDPERRPAILEVQLVLKRLGEHDLRKYGMDRRRTR